MRFYAYLNNCFLCFFPREKSTFVLLFNYVQLSKVSFADINVIDYFHFAGRNGQKKCQFLSQHLHSGLPPIAPLSGEGYMQMREGGWLAYFFSGFLLPSLDSAERYIYADEVGFVKCFQVFPLWFCLNTQVSVSNPRQSQRVKLNQRQIFRLNFLN